ncbi:MAG: hypothetical protein JXA67_04810, partial [Micromonosporaceae bacterium]|nr:hypothetical protein [Micromonosporaceae bacterium]
MTDHQILAVTSVALPALFACLLMITPRRWMTAVSLASGTATGAIAAAVAAGSIIGYRDPEANGWIVLDAAGGLLVAVVGAVGLIGVWVSPAYLRSVDGPAPRSADSPAPRHRGPRVYYSVFFAFWAILLAVPLIGNLGGAWILIEATTAASALLVGFTGKPRALEAGWKYLVLTSLGLGVALLGIALIAAGIPGGGLGALSWRALATYDAGQQAGTVAYLLLIAGLAAKIGWAPVHNWLPDAHSEAPAPVSAILSAALLPTVLLIAWRCQQGLAPA